MNIKNIYLALSLPLLWSNMAFGTETNIVSNPDKMIGGARMIPQATPCNTIQSTNSMKRLPLEGVSNGEFSIPLPPVDDPVYMRGSPRPRSGIDWRASWENRKSLLLEHCAPTEEEKKRVLAALPRTPLEEPSKERRVLVYYRQTYPHRATATGKFMIEQMGEATGAYTADFTDRPEDITPKNLAGYDALVLNNNVGWDRTLDEAGRSAVLEYVRGGGGLVAIHAAKDACKQWPEGEEMLGAVFSGQHPWITRNAWAFKLESPEHILNGGFNSSGFWHAEEIYKFRGNGPNRDVSRVLVSLDMSQPRNFELLPPEAQEQVDPEIKYAVAWIHPFGDGRVFSSNFGHNYSTYWQPHILKHYLAGIQFATGDIEADATPSSQLKETNYAYAPSWTLNNND